MIISEAFLAICVPVIPIANPTSALIKAGASFVPSPVTATTLFSLINPSTSRYLWWGFARATTAKPWTIFWNLVRFYSDSKSTFYTFFFSSLSSWWISLFVRSSLSNSSPSIILRWLSSMMFTYSEMDFAVSLLSPVTIIVVTPAFRQLYIAGFDSGLGRSCIPKIPRRVKPSLSIGSISPTPSLLCTWLSVVLPTNLYPTATVLNPFLVSFFKRSSIRSRLMGMILLEENSIIFLLAFKTTSLAPLVKIKFFPCVVTPVVILFLFELKGNLLK